MSLPVRIASTHYYRIAGRYIFAGDLFIARQTIYFFPLVDLAEQRSKALEYAPHHFGLIALAAMYLVQNLNTCASLDELWQEGVSDQQFRKKADAYIEKLKERRKAAGSSGELPLPTRATADEISNIKLSLTGKLSFFAQSDNHDFNPGWRRKQRLRDALWESGLGRV